MKLLQRLRMWIRMVCYRLSAERAEFKFVLGRHFDGGSVLDIGAHRGEYSYWLHNHFRARYEGRCVRTATGVGRVS